MMDKLVLVLMWIIIIAVIAFGVYALVAYGDKPITEVPSWVAWMFLHRR